MLPQSTSYRAVLFHADDELNIRRISRQDECQLHSHDFHELVIVLKGKGVHRTSELSHVISGGDVLVLPPTIAHGYRDTTGLELVNVLYSSDRFTFPDADLPTLPAYTQLTLIPAVPGFSRLHLNATNLMEAARLVRGIDNELTAQAPGYRYAALALFMQLRGLLVRFAAKPTSPRHDALEHISRILSYIESNYAKPIRLEQLAAIGHTSISSLTRDFQTALGLTPIQYLLQMRLSIAADLLRSTGKPISQIALRVGFTDSSYFTRQFRRRHSLSPRQFRAATSS